MNFLNVPGATRLSMRCSSSIVDAEVLNSTMDRKGKIESAISTVDLLAIRVSSPDDGGREGLNSLIALHNIIMNDQ
jgi:hypothetical protein